MGIVGLLCAWINACKERIMLFEKTGTKIYIGFVPGLFILLKHQIRKKFNS